MTAVLALAVSLHASPFRYERNVTPGGPGANRLDVDVTLLAGAMPGLRDLRLFAGDRELGYLLVKPQRDPRWYSGAILPIRETKTSSGVEVDLGSTQMINALKIEGIATPFLKRVTLEGSGDRAHWTLLANTTLFDLPDEGLRHTSVEFKGGSYRYLRVTWDDRSSARVQGAMEASAREMLFDAGEEGPAFEVAFVKRDSEPGKSRYRLKLAGARLPVDSIRIVVPSGNVLRTATVTEPRLGNGEVVPVRLGSNTMRQEMRGDLVASATQVFLQQHPEGRELDLEIDDGNNPPLKITRIYAQLATQPWIYFESPDGAPLVARYGNDTAPAPRYDLEAVRDDVQKREPSTAAWGGIRNPKVARPTEAAIAIPLGATLDRARFRVRRRIPPAPVGLTVLLLDAPVLARPNALADVRIADDDGRQVPYLVERRPEPFVVPLKVPQRTAQGSSSVYRIDLPYEQWPDEARLVLTTTARVFERNVEVRTVADNHRNRRAETLAFAPWRAADPESLPPALSIDFSGRRARAIELVIDEGDNAPLPIADAQVLIPAYALRFQNPGTPLDLLYGNRRAGTPRYDIALLAPRLFGEPATEIAVPPIGAMEIGENDGSQRKLFWGGIIVAAVVLIAMLVRLLLANAETSRAPSDST
jgi:hypothetical protein